MSYSRTDHVYRGTTFAVRNRSSEYLFPLRDTNLYFLYPLFWQTSLTVDIIILLGYIGIIISIVSILREHFVSKAPTKKRKYLTTAEKETLIKMKKFIRYSAILCVLACMGIWVLEGDLPAKYVHLMILIIVNLFLGYIRISIQGKSSRFPSPSMLRDRRKSDFPRNTKIIMFMNALILLFFCVLFVRSRSAPFHGIWGVLAWAGTLLLSYSPALLVRELFESEKRPPYLLSLPLSWIFVFFWLGLGLGDETLGGITMILLIPFVIGLWLYNTYKKIR